MSRSPVELHCTAEPAPFQELSESAPFQELSESTPEPALLLAHHSLFRNMSDDKIIYNFTQCQGTKEQFKTESHFFICHTI